MAKTRAKTAKSGARKKSTKRRAAPRGGRRQVQLKPVFTRLTSSIEQLRRVEQTSEVKSAIVRLTRCLREIEEVCAPDMIIPLDPQ